MPKRTMMHFEVLRALREFFAEHGYSPTYEELREKSGLKSREAVHRLIGLLKRDGYVTCTPRSPRTFRLASEDEIVKIEARRFDESKKLETRGRAKSDSTNLQKSAAGTAGARKLLENARRAGVAASGVSRLPAADDPDVARRIEELGQLEDAVKRGDAPMRDVVMFDRASHLRLRVSGARKIG